MHAFVEAVRSAVRDGNSYAAVALALAFPDMCGSIVTPNARSSARLTANLSVVVVLIAAPPGKRERVYSSRQKSVAVLP